MHTKLQAPRRSHLHLLLLITAFLFTALHCGNAPIEGVVAEQPARPGAGLDFETYNRSVDDLFLIGLSANQNPEYGINALIIDLNRKLAEKPDDADTLAQLGHIYRILGQPEEANRFYKKAQVSDFRNFYLNVFTAKMHYASSELQKALEDYDRAIALNPKDPQVWIEKAKTHFLLGKQKEAVRDYERALELGPGNVEVLFILSLLYEKEGRPLAAARLSDELLARRPDDYFARFHRGAIYLVQNKPAKAVELWEKIFLEGQRDPQFLFNLAIAYIQNQNYEKAETVLGHLQFLFPREIDVDFLLGEAYRHLDKLELAEEKYREVLALEPAYVSASLGLAEVLKRQGKIKEGNEILSQLPRNFSPEGQLGGG